MYKNIDAEQARKNISNVDMARELGIHPISYWRKKKLGRFTANEARIICNVLNSSFDYLFKFTEEE